MSGPLCKKRVETPGEMRQPKGPPITGQSRPNGRPTAGEKRPYDDHPICNNADALGPGTAPRIPIHAGVSESDESDRMRALQQANFQTPVKTALICIDLCIQETMYFEHRLAWF